MGEQTMEELKRRLLAARIELAGRKIAAAGRAFGEGCDKDGDGLLMEGVRLLLDREANSSEQAARR